jgi:hypothetical protein
MARTDGHYCLIKFLARQANLPEADAELIAYASEMVDHATDHKDIYIENLPKRFNCLCKNGLFSPVCTAHAGIDYANFLWNKLALEKVLISFHFLPSKFHILGREFDYLTRSKSELFDILLRIILMEIDHVKNHEEHQFFLISLGILLHTFLDMHTHANFSGRHHNENDVERLIVEGESGNQEVGIIPDIGHGELMHFPDLSYAVFSYENHNGEIVCRNNPEIFMKAAKEIYAILCELSISKVADFSSFEAQLDKCFRFHNSDLGEIIHFWEKEFPDMEFNFDPDLWKDQAIKPRSIDAWTQSRYQVSEAYYYKDEPKSNLWFLFHVAAAAQREFVLDNIKRL